jgi:hypothetical protein
MSDDWHQVCDIPVQYTVGHPRHDHVCKAPDLSLLCLKILLQVAAEEICESQADPDFQVVNEGDVAESGEEASGELKKSASAGSAVFTLLARAGASPGPPSRQSSREFAAEHGIATPTEAARSEASGLLAHISS